jgi:hypothetical protein
MRPTHHADGFSLLEVIFAILIFSTAVIALVEAINGMGETAIAAQRSREVSTRLDSLLLELTRNPPRELNAPDATFEKALREDDVDYKFAIQPVDLKNKDGAALRGIFSIQATARWADGSRTKELNSDTWFYPPLFVSPAPSAPSVAPPR